MTISKNTTGNALEICCSVKCFYIALPVPLEVTFLVEIASPVSVRNTVTSISVTKRHWLLFVDQSLVN